jgi:hypothetical protein
MATITVRFRGICCFIDKTTKANPFNKRVVLPNGKSHQHGDNKENHLSIIEFFADDLKSAPDDLPRFGYTRPGDGGQYQLFLLEEAVHIELLTTSPTLGPVPQGRITPGINLEDSLIHLHELVDQKIQLKRTLLGPATQVDPTLVSAVVDLPKGVLMAGPPEPMITKFPSSPKFSDRRAARWLEHIFELGGKESEFGLKLTPLGKLQAESKEIWFKSSTRMITIANEPLRFIVGHFVVNPPKPVEKSTEKSPASTGPQTVAKTGANVGTQSGTAALTMDMDTPPGKPTGHFDMYWDLVADPPARPRPIPEPSLGLGPGCAPANIP